MTLDLHLSTVFNVALNASVTTLTITPADANVNSFLLLFTADGTPRTVAWGASVKWAGGTPPTLTSTAGQVDVFTFFSPDGGTTWYGSIVGQNF